jgi:RimJ/RimL family protein N-acetyltransferase
MIKFIAFELIHLSMFQKWLSQDHVKPFWQEPESVIELKEKFFGKLPPRGVHSFIIEESAEIIGYIQYYDACKVGGGWWEDELQGTFGIDIMIGDPNHIGKGKGKAIISEFVSFLKEKEPLATNIIIDPEPANKKAIHVFEKAGFKIEKEIKTPNGMAVLMRLQLK